MRKTNKLLIFSLFLVFLSVSVLGLTENDPDVVAYYSGDNTTHNLTMEGSPEGIAGKINGAIDFDGSTDYILLPSNFIDGQQTDLTINYWFNPDTLASIDTIISDYTSATDCTITHFFESDGSTYLDLCMSDGTRTNYYFNNAHTISTGSWQMITLQWDYSTKVISLWINGISKENYTTSVTSTNFDTSTIDYWIGDQTGFAREIDGKLDDFRIYKSKLNSSEIQELYNNSSGTQDATTTSHEVQLTMDFLYDYTNQSNDLTNNGASINTEGILNSAYDLESTESDYISMSDNIASVSGDNIGSISVWVKPESIPTTGAIWGFGDLGVSTARIRLHVESATNKFHIYSNTGTAYSLYGNTTISVGNWYHVVVTQDASNYKMYVNGVLQTLTGTNGGAWFNDVTTPDVWVIGHRPYAVDSFWDGLIDEFSYWNKTLNSTEISELYNSGAPTSEQQYPFTPLTQPPNESTETTIFGQSLSTINVNSPSYVTLISANYEIEQNNTHGYFTIAANILSGVTNTGQCRILVSGDIPANDFNSTITFNNEPDVLNSIFLITQNVHLNAGNYTNSFQCLRNFNNYDVSNIVGVGHFMIDEAGNEIPHEEQNIQANTTSTTYSLLGSQLITTGNQTTNGITHNIVVDWGAQYTNNAGTREELNTYVSINGINCSSYPRSVAAGNTRIVGGNCLLQNATSNSTYNISVYGKGSSADFDINLFIKSLFVHTNESGSVDLTNKQILTDTSFSEIASFNVEIQGHVDSNLFIKAGIPILSNETTNSSFRFVVKDGSVNFTSPEFGKGVANTSSVNIIHYLVQNIPVDVYNVSLQAKCGNSNCNISGGEMIAYLTDSKSVIKNAFNLSLFDNYDNSSINNFSATLSTGTVFSTTLGSVLIFSDVEEENITITSTYNGGYFSNTVYDHNTSLDLISYLNQTYISWDCVEKISGTNLNCSSPPESTIFNYNIIGNPYSQSVNVSGYYEKINIFNVTALQSETKTSTHYSTNLTLQAQSSLGAISNCVYNVSGITYPSYFESLSGAPNSSVGLINGTYSVLADCTGYAYLIQNVTITNTTQNLLFNLLTTNSVNLTFYDTNTNILLNGTNVTTTFIGATAQTNITNTGSLYVDLLNPSEYTILFSAPNYRQGSYIFTLDDRDNINIPLYLEKSNETELVLINVINKYSKEPIQGAKVTIQKYKNDGWLTDQIVSTDFQGFTEAYFILSTVYYNFLVEYEGVIYFGAVNSNENKKTIFAEDVTNGISIEIDTSPFNTVPSYQTSYDIYADVRFINRTNTTGYFIFQFDDTKNIPRQVVLNVTKSDGSLACTNSVTSESGNINCFINVTSGEIEYYTGTGFVLLGSEWVPVDVAHTYIGIDETTSFDWVSTGIGYILSFFVVLIAFLIFAKIPSMSVLSGTIAFSILIVFRVIFKELELGLLVVFLFGAYLLSRIPSKSGVNA